MSHERDAIARAFSRPFIEPPKRATAKRVSLTLAGIALLAAGGRKTLTMRIRKDAQVKAAILLGAVALAIGATAWHNNQMSISDIIGSKPVGLQCQYADVTEYYSKSGGSTTSTTKQHTMVIELNGRTWRMVTIDGQSWKELIEQTAKAIGKKMDASVSLNTPLRVTDETYVLMEPHENHEGTYNSKDNGSYVDRISGTVTGESWTSEKGAQGLDSHLTSNGHCSPIDINAKL